MSFIMQSGAHAGPPHGPRLNTREETPRFLLIVRERLREGSEEAYDENERAIATVCAILHCPHPYLALATVAGPTEVWWLNAFSSEKERDALEASYARNERLMVALRPLGQRKEEFRHTHQRTMTEYRRDLSTGSVLQIAGARYVNIRKTLVERREHHPVFQAADGNRFVIAPVSNLAAAEHLDRDSPSGAVILAVQPQWSFPAQSWIDADPEFWRDGPVARGPRR
jgi:hypothetical protein